MLRTAFFKSSMPIVEPTNVNTKAFLCHVPRHEPVATLR
jgi:hypothetical protein